jgi:cellulose synthase/poly-beta-1,6-N-acetylglucosamine synthase-like glycosyltransferase
MEASSQTEFPNQTAAAASQTVGDKLDVSVVIPCLNEANSLAFCVEKIITAMRSAGLRGEVIVADNGSTDGSIFFSRQGARRRINFCMTALYSIVRCERVPKRFR